MGVLTKQKQPHANMSHLLPNTGAVDAAVLIPFLSHHSALFSSLSGTNMDAVISTLNLTRPIVSPLFISDACFDTLVLDLDIFHVACLKQTLSTCAGYAIVVFAAVLKLPLILNIVRHKSVDSLATSSVYLETTMYLAVLVYYYFLQSPLSTYGEKYVLLAQNLVICVLIWVYGKKSILFQLASTVGFGAVAFGMIYVLPPPLRPYLIVYSSFGAITSRVPQILLNFRNGHTGILSLASLGAAVAGASVRLLTVLQDVDDKMAVVGELLPLGLNIAILLQVVSYRESTRRHLAKEKKE